MATWHQEQNPVPLWHKTKWTVVNDPPRMLTTVMRFDTPHTAEAYMDRMKSRSHDKHMYLLRPQGD